MQKGLNGKKGASEVTTTKRERKSDELRKPLVYYVYIMQNGDDGQFYIGQTNDLEARVLEHSLDAGAEATKGGSFGLVWFTHTHDRDMAKRMEERLQRTLARSPLEIEELVDRFDRLLALIRPQKTLVELREESRRAMIEAEGAFHHIPLTWGISGPTCAKQYKYNYEYASGQGMIGPYPKWYGTSDWKELAEEAIVHAKAKSVGVETKLRWGRSVCKRCLAVMPAEFRAQMKSALADISDKH